MTQQQERITHISHFMLCRLVVFVNDAACFNFCSAYSPDETRTTVRYATRSRNTAGRMGLAVRGELLAHGAASPGIATRQ